MFDFMVFASPIIAIIFFVNFVSLLKNIHRGEDTGFNTIVGSITLGVLLYFIMFIIVSR
jgi:hypothetical protein